MSSSDRVHVESGRRGIIVTAIPGALTSIGIRPVATSTESQTSIGGISSGVPVPLRLGDVGVADAIDRLRPGAAVRADARRRSGADAAGVDAIGNHVGDERVEQREEIRVGGQEAERSDGEDRAERRPLTRCLRVSERRLRQRARKRR